jgi:peptidoglycan hydrolase FlgJ
MSAIPTASVADTALLVSKRTTLAAATNTPSEPAGSPSDKVRQSKLTETGQQFEAIYLREMLDEWLPKDSESLFGEGTAGSVWRSMMTDSLATTLSKSGTIGIAQLILKGEFDGTKGK